MSKMRCPVNVKHSVFSWGANRSGTRRFRCSVCKLTFTPKRVDVSRRNRFSWLRAWLRGSTIPAIARSSRRSPETIRRAIYRHLERPLKPNPTPNPNCHLIIDGTWFGREHCLVVYWDSNLKRAQWWRFTTGERMFEVLDDLRRLRRAGVIPASITSDGAPGIVRAVEIPYPHVPHQRCVVRLQRHCLAWITKNPRSQAGREIKPLLQWLSEAGNYELRDQWVGEFKGWCYRWEEFLKERAYSDDGKHWWYTHKQLRRVRSAIQNAIPNLFHYLDDPTIPKTSNGLEGRFSSLKLHYRQHRGLSKERRGAYLAWYLTAVVNR